MLQKTGRWLIVISEEADSAAEKENRTTRESQDGQAVFSGSMGKNMYVGSRVRPRCWRASERVLLPDLAAKDDACHAAKSRRSR